MTDRAQPEVEICFGPQCSDAGSRDLAAELKASGISCTIGDCRGQCPHAPLVLVDQHMISKASVEKVEAQLAARGFET